MVFLDNLKLVGTYIYAIIENASLSMNLFKLDPQYTLNYLWLG